MSSICYQCCWGTVLAACLLGPTDVACVSVFQSLWQRLIAGLDQPTFYVPAHSPVDVLVEWIFPAMHRKWMATRMYNMRKCWGLSHWPCPVAAAAAKALASGTAVPLMCRPWLMCVSLCALGFVFQPRPSWSDLHGVVCSTVSLACTFHFYWALRPNMLANCGLIISVPVASLCQKLCKTQCAMWGIAVKACALLRCFVGHRYCGAVPGLYLRVLCCCVDTEHLAGTQQRVTLVSCEKLPT
jgi:hypothetical protein